jgi:hypothetical protein
MTQFFGHEVNKGFLPLLLPFTIANMSALCCVYSNSINLSPHKFSPT